MKKISLLKIALILIGSFLFVSFSAGIKYGFAPVISQPYYQAATTTRFAGTVSPQKNNLFDLGEPSFSWRNIYASGTAFLTNVNISGSCVGCGGGSSTSTLQLVTNNGSTTTNQVYLYGGASTTNLIVGNLSAFGTNAALGTGTLGESVKNNFADTFTDPNPNLSLGGHFNYVWDTSADAAAQEAVALGATLDVSSTFAIGDAIGNSTNVTISNASSVDAIYGGNWSASNNSLANVNFILGGGFQAANQGNNTSSQVFALSLQTLNAGGGHVNDQVGLSINTPAGNTVDTENNYGILIQNQKNVGATSYSIESLGGNVDFTSATTTLSDPSQTGSGNAFWGIIPTSTFLQAQFSGQGALLTGVGRSESASAFQIRGLSLDDGTGALAPVSVNVGKSDGGHGIVPVSDSDLAFTVNNFGAPIFDMFGEGFISVLSPSFTPLVPFTDFTPDNTALSFSTNYFAGDGGGIITGLANEFIPLKLNGFFTATTSVASTPAIQLDAAVNTGGGEKEALNTTSTVFQVTNNGTALTTIFGNGSMSTLGALSVGSNVTTTGNIFPSSNNAFDIGSPLFSWRNIYASGTSRLEYVSSTAISTTGVINASGAVSGASFNAGGGTSSFGTVQTDTINRLNPSPLSISGGQSVDASTNIGVKIGSYRDFQTSGAKTIQFLDGTMEMANFGFDGVFNAVSGTTMLSVTSTSAVADFPGLGTPGVTQDLVCWTATIGRLTHQATTCTVSSARFKENIKSLSSKDLLTETLRLRSVSFDFKNGYASDQGINGGGKESTGFIAEEVALIDPMLVVYTSDFTPEDLEFEKKNYPESILYKDGKILIPKAVDYARVSYVTVGAIQAQQDQIKAQDIRLSLLEKKVGVLSNIINVIKRLLKIK